MSILNDIPFWLGTGIFGVITGALGYVIRQRIESSQRRTKERIEDRSKHLQRLENLITLLSDSRDIFLTQKTRVEQLMNKVSEKVPENVKRQGYDATFRYIYDKYTDDERSLHELIRSVTMGRLYYVNKKLQDWLDEGYNFLSAPSVPLDLAKKSDELHKMLDVLRRHLIWWLPQYDRDMVSHPDPAHALVYANDERGQGEEFPKGIEQVADDVVAGWRKHVKS